MRAWAGILLCTAGCVAAPAFEDCAVRCTNDLCPEGLTCLSDHFCHPLEAQPLCGLDGGGDAGGPTPDGRADGPLLPPPDANPECQVAGTDDACTMCMKMNCCEPLAACLMDTVCTCYVECYLATGNEIECITTCGSTSPPTANLASCRSSFCTVGCP